MSETGIARREIDLALAEIARGDHQAAAQRMHDAVPVFVDAEPEEQRQAFVIAVKSNCRLAEATLSAGTAQQLIDSALDVKAHAWATDLSNAHIDRLTAKARGILHGPVSAVPLMTVAAECFRRTAGPTDVDYLGCLLQIVTWLYHANDMDRLGPILDDVFASVAVRAIADAHDDGALVCAHYARYTREWRGNRREARIIAEACLERIRAVSSATSAKQGTDSMPIYLCAKVLEAAAYVTYWAHADAGETSRRSTLLDEARTSLQTIMERSAPNGPWATFTSGAINTLDSVWSEDVEASAWEEQRAQFLSEFAPPAPVASWTTDVDSRTP